MMRILWILPIMALSGCLNDETISGFVPMDAEWRAIEGPGSVSGATISFPEKGRVAGRAPCNQYFASQSAPYPWIEIGAIGATRMACPNLDEEAAFFAALEAARLAEIAGDILILSAEDGTPLLTFSRLQPA